MLYLIGVSLYRRRVALTGSDSGSTHLPPHSLKDYLYFFLPHLVVFGSRLFFFPERIYFFYTDRMTETRKKDKKGKKKGNKRGQRERDREPAAGKRKSPSNLFYFVLHIIFFFFRVEPETYFFFIKKKKERDKDFSVWQKSGSRWLVKARCHMGRTSDVESV